MIIFIFSLSHSFPSYYGLKFSRSGFFFFLFLIFYFTSCRNETERSFLFSLFLGLFQPILARNEAIMVFFTFFASCCGVFILCFRQEQNGTIIFIFYLSHPFPSFFGFKCSHNGIVLYFEFFYYIFEIMYFASGRNKTE